MFDQTNISFEELPQAAMSSGSIPVVFPPQHFHGYVLMDGGTVWDINIDSAVNQCLDAGYDEKDIIMDVIVCGYSEIEEKTITNNAYHNYEEGQSIRNLYSFNNAIQPYLRSYPDVETRYYIQGRDYDCDVPSSIIFNNSTTWCLQEKGRADAKKFLDLGQEEVHRSLDSWEKD